MYLWDLDGHFSHCTGSHFLQSTVHILSCHPHPLTPSPTVQRPLQCLVLGCRRCASIISIQEKERYSTVQRREENRQIPSRQTAYKSAPTYPCAVSASLGSVYMDTRGFIKFVHSFIRVMLYALASFPGSPYKAGWELGTRLLYVSANHSLRGSCYSLCNLLFTDTVLSASQEDRQNLHHTNTQSLLITNHDMLPYMEVSPLFFQRLLEQRFPPPYQISQVCVGWTPPSQFDWWLP